MKVYIFTGLRNSKSGYESLVEAARVASQNFNPIQQREVVIHALERAFPRPILSLASPFTFQFLQKISVEENDLFSCIRLNSSFLFFSTRKCGAVFLSRFPEPSYADAIFFNLSAGWYKRTIQIILFSFNVLYNFQL